jgi:hypothetical protein
MKPLFHALIAASLVLGEFSALHAQVAPMSETVVRRAGEPLQKVATASKAITRTESYLDTETYWESVPYQDQEAYQDIEYYNSYEYVCRDVRRTRRECRWERECGYGRLQLPGWMNVLVQKVYAMDPRELERRERASNPNLHPPTPRPGPGPGPVRPGPGPGPVRPDPGPVRPGPICRDVQRCYDVPDYGRECHYENVPRTRYVTRYRTVTRYRQEQRTRTVTKYREVFDHQWTASVTLNFPMEAQLIGPQIETFQLQLIGSETNPQLSVTPLSTVYSYVPQIRVINANQIEVDMRLVGSTPAFDPAPYMDPNQTGKFVVDGFGAQTEIWFRDLTADIPQVSTQYEFLITDSAGRTLANRTFDRRNVRVSDGRLKLRLVEDFGVGGDVISQLRPGLEIVINYKAIRYGNSLNPNPFVINKRVTLTIQE